MSVVIFDIEATCDKNNEDIIMETIEIGAVKLNHDLEIVDIFEIMIKPVYSHITEFCTELTGITAREIGVNGVSFKKAIEEFEEFLEGVDIAYSWGDYDKEQLIDDCMRHNIDDSFLSIHRNMKHRYREVTGVRAKGLMRAINYLKLEFIGDRHRALPDAEATTEVYKELSRIENGYVYCTDCVRFKPLMKAINDETNIPKNCDNCYPYDLEDSYPFSIRKMFKRR